MWCFASVYVDVGVDADVCFDAVFILLLVLTYGVVFMQVRRSVFMLAVVFAMAVMSMCVCCCCH